MVTQFVWAPCDCIYWTVWSLKKLKTKQEFFISTLTNRESVTEFWIVFENGSHFRASCQVIMDGKQTLVHTIFLYVGV